jgi:hypothetical protein
VHVRLEETAAESWSRDKDFGRRRSRKGQRAREIERGVTLDEGPGSEEVRRRAVEADGKRRRARSAAAMASPTGVFARVAAAPSRQRNREWRDRRLQRNGEERGSGSCWARPDSGP